MITAAGQKPRRPWRVKAAAAALAACTAFVAACSTTDGPVTEESQGPTPSDEYFGYLTNSRLETTNAATAFGNATNAEVLSGRLYPSAFVPAPSGQLLPNSDLVGTRELAPEGEDGPRRILYTLTDDAKYSDGTPVTCEDYLLSYTAGKMASVFGSHLPLMKQVSSLQCGAGSKNFIVTLNKDQGARWRFMFGPGTVMPSHTIAKKAGLSQEELVSALYSEDAAALEDVARIWRYGFSTTNFDPELQVSFGPFAIDRIGEDGEVVLKANENYYGNQPVLEHLTVWPAKTDGERLAESGALKIVDSSQKSPAWLDRNDPANPYEIYPQVGEMTDSLIFSDGGVLAEQWARQAFAGCIDQKQIAKVSSDISGTDVDPVYVHTLRHGDPLIGRLSAIADEHQGTDMEQAGGLSGTTVRIGYLGPDERYAAMVESIKQACEPAGIIVEDASAQNMSQAHLEIDPNTWVPGVDVFLGPVDPMYEFATADAFISQLAELRDAEKMLWDQLPSIPLSAQPRTFIVDRGVENVVPFTGLSGIGWNMDRWRENPNAESSEASEEPSEQ